MTRFQSELETLFRENHLRIYRAAYSVTGNHGDAEDVLQNIFLKLSQGQPSSNFDKNPEGYLYRAAINEAVSILRSRERRTLADDDVEGLEMPAPEVESGRDDRIDRMRAAMAKMKPSLIETMNLRYKEELPCSEIARIRGKPVGTVLADLFRGRRQMRKLMRIQEKQGETQHEKHETDRRQILADTL